MKSDCTYVTMLLDRSGSMMSIQDDVIGGVRQFIDKQQDGPGECIFTLIQFDDQNPREVVIDKKNVKDIQPSEVKLQPRGWTPLRDALGLSIVNMGSWLGSLPEDQRPEQVVFVVVTDGLENASKEYTAERIRDMIAHQEKVYSWQFVYLGANQDAFAVGGGIGVVNAANYDPTAGGTRAAFAASGDNVRGYREEKTSGALLYKADQLKEMSAKNKKS